MTIRFQRPELPPPDDVVAYFAESQDARWFSNFGPCHERLVQRVTRRLPDGVFAVPVANCTLGLMLALRAVTEERDGTEVLVPSFTFAATAAAIRWAGLTPVFVDVDADHWMLTPAALDAALDERGERVAAVLAGATFGAAPPASVAAAWERSTARAGVPLIVDSAAGFGASNESGVALGAIGTAEVFSWHATKPFAIGEGGLITTRDERLAERARALANFGFDSGIVVAAPGINAKLPEWACATALAVDDRFDDILLRRRASAARILEELAACDLTPQRSGGQPTWQFVPVLAPDQASRDHIMRATEQDGVELRAYFGVPLHRMPAFAQEPQADELAVTSDLAGRVLSLPMANDLSAEEESAITDAVIAACASVPSSAGSQA